MSTMDDDEGMDDETSSKQMLATDNKLKLITKEFVKLKEDYVKNGIKEVNFNKFLRCHFRGGARRPDLNRGRGWCHMSWKLLYCLLVPSLIATVIGVYLHHSDIDVIQAVYETPCLISSGAILAEIGRPLKDCSTCQGLTQVPVVESISQQYFLDQFAFTEIPLLVKQAAANWSALHTFDYKFFQKIYTNQRDLDQVIDECQFFSYRTEFNDLAEALDMPEERASLKPGQAPWYFGWSNCIERTAKKLRRHYTRPYFLPADSDADSRDWIFMGWAGPGAHIHLDFVHRPSWQAQISGKKTWTLIPVPECEAQCHTLNVTVERGDIFVVDTNQWYHSTFIHEGELSITIGAEFE